MHALLSQQIQKYILHVELPVTNGTFPHRHVDCKYSIDGYVDPHHRIDAAPIVKQHPDCHDIHR